jgi:hypothetical protein
LRSGRTTPKAVSTSGAALKRIRLCGLVPLAAGMLATASIDPSRTAIVAMRTRQSMEATREDFVSAFPG